MDLTLALMGLSLYILLWEKLPDWGNWFNALLARLPRPLTYLYEAWHCPFCFGFWAALALHGLTGIVTIEALFTPPAYLGSFGLPIAWFLDALATATLIMAASLGFKAISGPAIRGHQMTEEFRNSFKQTQG
ncbi:hypothetical protein [Shewanella sedimentimangrovi]|uniref:DUF1360 domain-containing protein n=1 Tax=Shewanella sedimentimangrovi TaxID=2814293 RepID=A0ABX7QWL3_9GAMM|nr:hypothetical protein [Shewanella sedimentimangrovi]QSX35894.1 hypothetical protein JYB85_11050 [Shewanella sedimentimangrovi]